MTDSLGQRLAHLRKLAELETTREVDALIRDDREEGTYTWFLETGRRDIGRKIAIKYADLYGCTLDWLLAGRGAAPRREDVQRAVARARRRVA